MNYLALIITLVLAFVYLLLGGEEIKKIEPKGSSSFLHHDYFGLKSLLRKFSETKFKDFLARLSFLGKIRFAFIGVK